jgi:hypothetical protein
MKDVPLRAIPKDRIGESVKKIWLTIEWIFNSLIMILIYTIIIFTIFSMIGGFLGLVGGIMGGFWAIWDFIQAMLREMKLRKEMKTR